MACFDPNAGDKNHTACIFFYIDQNWNIVICNIDTKQTIEYQEFLSFFTDNMILVHNEFRRDTSIPIIAVVESQSSWNGDVMKDRLNYLVHEKGVKELENIYFISDKSKQKHGKMRCGVTINSPRLNEMTYRLSSALAYGAIKIHVDWVTASEHGKRRVMDEFESQIRRFRHFDDNMNSGFTSNGARRKNNTGKDGILNDDISDALHMTAWAHWFLFKPEYADQRRLLRL